MALRVIYRRADHRLPWPVFTRYLPRLTVPGRLFRAYFDQSAARQISGLFDHLVGKCKQSVRHRETEGLRCLKVD
jgi:hypothetical protein